METKSNNEIDVPSLLDKARKYNEMNNFTEAEYYANLAILTAEHNHIYKIQALGIKSYVNNIHKNTDILLSIARKFQKFINKKQYINEDTTLAFIRGLYRMGKHLMEKRNIFLATYFIYKTKVFVSNNLKEDQTTHQIEETFNYVLNEVSKILDEEKLKVKQNQLFLENSKNYFATTHGDINIENTSVYLVSTLWLNNFIHYLNKDPMAEKQFDRRNVLLLYFNDGSNKEDYKRYQGHFPGPINNLHLTDSKDYWFDPDEREQHTNIYLRLEAGEKTDFVYLPANIWNDLKAYYSCNFEIERRVLSNKTVEIHLKRIKILILSDLLTDRNLHLIKPRYIQISKYDTVKDLKAKIYRCLCHALGMKITADNVKSRLFVPEFTDHRNRELFQIIHAYIGEFESLNLKGIELADESHQIIVNLC
jgi:hypothetical protein